MLIPNNSQFPIRVKVTNSNECVFFAKRHTWDSPAVRNGETIVITSRPQGFYSWFYFHTADNLGTGKPSGMVYISAIEAINE